MSCNCELCIRGRKIHLLIERMREKGLEKDVQFLEELTDLLDEAEFELACITTGMSNTYLSTKEVMSRFNISKEQMDSFLKERRDKLE